MTPVHRLKRVFSIDIEHCRACGGRLEVIASVEQRDLIERILSHLQRAAESADSNPKISKSTPRFDCMTCTG